MRWLTAAEPAWEGKVQRERTVFDLADEEAALEQKHKRSLCGDDKVAGVNTHVTPMPSEDTQDL